MLFQPSNILPDIINGLGNGTVDLSDGLDVSWQINGNSAMTAYEIHIYLNNTASTEMYTTGKITHSTDSNLPATGVNYQGERTRFSTSITAQTLSSNNIVNGNEYKLKIVQYYQDPGVEKTVSWTAYGDETLVQPFADEADTVVAVTYNGVSVPYVFNKNAQSVRLTNTPTAGTIVAIIYRTEPEENSVEQRSMSVFHTRNAPTVSINSITSDTLATREYSFTASYSQAQLDPLTWVRWRLYNNTNESDTTSQYDANLLYDTGKMYGVSTLKFDYDAFLNDKSYNLVLNIETSNGIQKETSYQFSTSWQETVLTDEVLPTAFRTNRQSTAVKVSWNGFKYIKGVPTGDVQVRNGTAILSSGNSKVTWSEINGSPLSVEEPWVLMLKTKLNKADANIIKLYDSSNNVIVDIQYDASERSLKFTGAGVSSSPVTISSIGYNDTLRIMVTPSFYKVQDEGYAGRLLPSATLKPSPTLTPQEERTRYILVLSPAITGFTQSDIAKIETFGVQNVDFVQIVSGDEYVTADTIAQMEDRLFTSLNYNPDINTFDGTEFLATFNNETLDAGRLTIAGTSIVGWAVYRESQRLNEMIHLLDVDVGMSSFYDYGCGSDQGGYRYSIYPIGDQKYITAGLFTEWIRPCYENWSIVEAVPTNEGFYKVINEYVFGKNFSSGSVSNNNTPTISKNFTRYATVQMDNTNYQSGTLSGLIGYIGYVSYIIQAGDSLEEIALRYGTTVEKIIEDNEDIPSLDSLTEGQVIKVFYPEGITAYRDDKELRDDIWELSTTRHHLFLKSRKGDVIEIRIAGEISMETMDASPLQPLSVSIPWVQVDDASKARLIGGVG